MNPKPQNPSPDPERHIGEKELLRLIADALEGLSLDLATERDKRIYLAYVAARLGAGEEERLTRRLEQLREELGL